MSEVGRKYPKLSHRVQKLASKYIAEEKRTHKYGEKQAEAIGISRAKQFAKKHPLRKRK
jgi:hypothetical protein